MKTFFALLALGFLAACGGQPAKPGGEGTGATPAAVPPAPTLPAKPPGYTLKRGGGFYQDDGPAADIPVDLASVPDAVPRVESMHRFANRPYSVLGRDYVPLQSHAPFRQQGIASWYGRQFHGRKTSSGEPYDMFGMTAAHPTLPIPSYVRVTRPETGKAVVVRVNDRGPFLHNRVIDLSYTAAWKLDLIGNGSGTVIVEKLSADTFSPPSPVAEPFRIALAEAPPAADKPNVLRDIEERSGHYLQLGAFGNRDNAESLRARLALTLGELGDRLLIRSASNLYRLQLGPWPDIGEARRIAEQLQSSFDLPSVLVK
ncbi:MAG: septal ring lytic transglycosylase RlpA family protein [Gammaproteobacteria bacterium]|nr:septal ring lytic transglycosylase RlpA family protein [Rhodocyclaceae bacterium]MBU3908010.1 septal ring lytic transglycosylase RlpA family protein [Gammaproteobacteria bacterium]MBU3990608.1 septal ring lytic transglycosylase RlpA family protein [Gammaproteobacteria bacterium]MBU4006059.1 septal ring lytic transglycosylase RlpA family protein [Gammaproteobacteria bacterium]MBU4022060.1 septal ring lytic transglycosylase RlpA family protein [Gammaproteobacteria bacterium]